MIVVLINDTVKKYLLKQSEGIRKKIRNKFEFLETGIWDGGLKVKKLKGVSSKYVFEARMDKANRILFTLGGGESATPANLFVYVWGIVVHDNISKKSKNIIPGNVSFLQFRNYDEVLLDNVDMEELEPSYFTQENITEKIADESGSQRWYSVDEPEWRRIQLYHRDDFELFLYLTPEQKDILKTPLPLMISGTAGSGKTTLSVYYLLNRNLNRKKKLFITYNRHLKNFAKKLYNGLLNEREWKGEVIAPDFYTFKDLCLEIAGSKQFLPEKEVDFNRFNQLYVSYPGHHSFDPVLVWEEIRSIIKGAVPRVNLPVLEKAYEEIKKGNIRTGLIRQLQAQFILFSKLESMQVVNKFVQKYLKINTALFAADIERFLYLSKETNREREAVLTILDKTLHTLKKQDYRSGKKYLSFHEYELLGKKKAPNFKFNRKEIYRIFEWYQDKLERENLWDELDLIPGVVGEQYTYDILTCDEVQDFTDTQLDLLFNLVKNPDHMFLAGDTKQTINPSGFRWEEVRKHFYERGLTVPGLKMLTLNFRSSGSVVELSNILLELKEKLTGKKAEESKEEWKYKGRPVTVVSDINSGDMLDILKAAGARRTILVRTETEKEKLKKHLETELVFTIKEAKGLEFDTVVLWKFCQEQPAVDVWKKTLDMSARNIHEAKIKHEINLLYVGITRSQKDLIIYDGGKPSLIWESDPIKNNVYITDDRYFIEGIWNVVSTPGEWVEQGRYFFERGYFKAAVECFKNGGDEKGLAKARAFFYEKTGNYREAALNFEKIKETGKAAENYEKGGEYKRALVLWEKLKNKARIFECRTSVLQGEGKFPEAGQLYLKKKKYNEAVECFKQSKNYREIAEIYIKHLKNNREAAQYYEYSRDYEKAAGLYACLKSYEKAADLYYRNKNYPKEEALWTKTKNTNRLLDLYQKTGQNEKLFLIYEKKKDFEKAVKYLKLLDKDKEQLKKEAETFLQKRRYLQALTRFFAAGDNNGIGESYYKMKKYRESIEYFEVAGDSYFAANAYYKIKDYQNAAKAYLDSQEDKKEDYVLGRKTLRKIYDMNFFIDTGWDYYKKKEYEKAIVIYSQNEEFLVKEGACYAHIGDKQNAFDTWWRCSHFTQIQHIADECLNYNMEELAAEFFLNVAAKSSHLKIRFFRGMEKTSIPKVMERYFKRSPDPVEMGTWGKFIAEEDFNCENSKQVIYYLEKTGQYNDLKEYFNKFPAFYEDKFSAQLESFEKDIPALTASGPDSYEALAFRYLLLEKTEELNRMLPKIKLRKDNLCLFLLGGEAIFHQKAFDWCIKNNFLGVVNKILLRHREDIKLAEFYERQGHLVEAAEFYKLGALFEKAAILFEKAGRYGRAGDCYYKQKEYEKALEVYKKQVPQDKKKIAKTYERLKDFEPALRLWKQLGHRKAIRRCIDKLEQEAQKQQRERPFPEG